MDELHCRRRLRAHVRAVIAELRSINVADEEMRKCRNILELDALLAANKATQ